MLHRFSTPQEQASQTIRCPVCNAPVRATVPPPIYDGTTSLLHEARSAQTAIAPRPHKRKTASSRSRLSPFSFKLVIGVIVSAIGILLLNLDRIQSAELSIVAVLALFIAVGAFKSQVTKNKESGWFTVELFFGRCAAGLFGAAIVLRVCLVTYLAFHRSGMIPALIGTYVGSVLGSALIFWLLGMSEEHGFFKVASWTFLVTHVFGPLFIGAIVLSLGKDPLEFYVQLHTPGQEITVFDRPAAESPKVEAKVQNAEPVIAPDEVSLAFGRESLQSLEKMVAGMQSVVDQSSLAAQKRQIASAGAEYIARANQAKAMINRLPESRKQVTIDASIREVSSARDAVIKRAEQEAVRLQTKTNLWSEVQKLLPSELVEDSTTLSANPPPLPHVAPDTDESVATTETSPSVEPARVTAEPAKLIVQAPMQRTFSSADLEFDRLASSAFSAGQFVQGIDYWRAELIVRGDEKLAEQFRWCPGLKRPVLGLVWAFAGTVVDEFEVPPFDSTDPLDVARQLTVHTGEVGAYSVEALERRIKQRLYGGYIELIEERPNQLEGLQLIPVGVQADVLLAARRQHCDVVVIGETQAVAGTSDRSIIVRLVDPLTEKSLWESESLRAAKIVRERKKGNDLAKDLVTGAVKYIEAHLTLSEMPKLKPDVVERRARALVATKNLTLNGLAELVFYQNAELHDRQKLHQFFVTVYGDEIGKLLVSGDENDRRLGLALIFEKEKSASVKATP